MHDILFGVTGKGFFFEKSDFFIKKGKWSTRMNRKTPSFYRAGI